MRDTLTCPKCRGYEVLIINRMPDVGDRGKIENLFVAAISRGQDGNEVIEREGRLTAAVCRQCGYTELYTQHPKYISVDGKTVRLERGPRTGASPYRQ